MKKIKWILVMTMALVLFPRAKSHAQIIDAINTAIEEAIEAVDLGVQKVQAQTIWLQNTEAQLENQMGLSNLNDISSWLKKEKDLYNNYYQELKTVRTVISDYDMVKQIIAQQKELMSEYKSAFALFRQDRNFSPDEINNMADIYSGILNESARDLTELANAITSFQAQMSDAERYALIHKAGADMQRNLDNMRQFNNANVQLSVERSQELNDEKEIRTLYGLPQN
ncbi:MAG: conjugal transfer protein TraI [Bacteroidetes bacterium]|nr:conjugal transfer protein TraI [Bacteroidota bacterium]